MLALVTQLLVAPPLSSEVLSHVELTAPTQGAVGEPVELSIRIDNGNHIAGWEAMLRYDPKALRFLGWRPSPKPLQADLGPVRMLGTAESADGVALGAYSCPAGVCGAATRDLENALPAGNVATVEFMPLRKGQIEIALDDVVVVDRTGAKLAHTVADPVHLDAGGGGQQHHAPARSEQPDAHPATPPVPRDATGDGGIDRLDATELLFEWRDVREQGIGCLGNCPDVADVQATSAAAEPNDDPQTAVPDGGNSEGVGHKTAANEMQVEASSESYAATFTVNSIGDQADAVVGDGVCLTSSTTCTLRAAIQEANTVNGSVLIGFGISGAGPHTIKPTTSLPTLSNLNGGITIDGYTQPEARPNDLELASNADIRIQLEGAGAGGHDGLRITSGGNTLRGIAVYKFRTNVRINGPDARNNKVIGSFVGTDATGTYQCPEWVRSANGIAIQLGASSNVIGRPNAADRNVLSGASHQGVATYDGGTVDNIIQNNIVGLDPSGTSRVKNCQHGIDVNYGSSNTIVGGTGPMEHNVVSGNNREGIEVSHGADTRFNRVIGNFVGTTLDGSRSEPYTINGNAGIRVEDHVGETVVSENIVGNSGAFGILVNGSPKRTVIERNWVGVTPAGTPIPNNGPGIQLVNAAQFGSVANNVIAHNAGSGIEVLSNSTNRNRLSRNSIYQNGGFGIDVEPLGVVNTRSVIDSSDGPSESVPIPVITSASPSAIRGTTCASCTVELFVADGLSTDHGEGQTFVRSISADTTGSFALPAFEVHGQVVTTTSTDSKGNTSEFSLNTAVPIASESNTAPTANFTASCTNLDCTFDGSASTDSDGSVEYWLWEFGDGSSAQGTTTTYSYKDAGDFEVKLTVADNGGATGSTAQTVTVEAPPPPGTFAFDEFDRTGSSGWGPAEIGGHWSHNNAASFSVDGSMGLTRLSSAGADRTAWLPDTSETEADVSVSFTADKPATGFGHIFSVVGRRVSNNVEYRARIRFDPNGSVKLAPVKVTGTSSEKLMAPEVTIPNVLHAPGRMIRTRIQVRDLNPTRIRIKVWEAANPEPTGWRVDITDTEPILQAAGSVGIRAYLASSATNAPAVHTFEDFHALKNVPPQAAFTFTCEFLFCDFDGSESTDPNGQISSYSWDFGDGHTSTDAVTSHSFETGGEKAVSLTVTDNEGVAHTVTQRFIATAPPPPAPFAQDDFQRSTTSGWGTADLGGSYSHFNPGLMFVNGTQGVMRITTADTSAAAWLPNTSQDNTDIRTLFSTDKQATGGGQFAYLIGRRVASNFEYRARVKMEANGTMRLAATRVAGAGAEETVGGDIAIPGLQHTINTEYWVRMQLTNPTDELTAIRIKVWEAGTTEPSAWAIDVTDDTPGLQDPGSVGLRGSLPSSATNMPVEIRFDQFLAATNVIQPSAEFTHDCVDTACTFDASNSFDPSGEIVSYEWDLGDGTTASTKQVEHTYATAGQYTVRLTVTNGDGAQDTVQKTIDVIVNQPPSAIIDTPSCIELDCDFDGSGSSDPDGTIASYEWDFGDGQTGTGATASHSYAADGTYTVTLTVTDDDGATGTATTDVTAVQLQELARDSFERTVSPGWGTADLGGAYTHFNASYLSVANGRGVMTLPSPNTNAAAWLLDVAETDVDMTVQVRSDKTATGFGQMLRLVGRRAGSGNEYRVRTRFESGKVYLAALKTVSGVSGETRIDAEQLVSGLSHAANTPIRVRVMVTGTSPTTIKARAWAEGATEPTSWHLSVTDNEPVLQNPGSVGLRASLSSSVTNAPVAIEFDEWRVTKPGA